MPYYLPVLLNPLVNAVFNCPTPGTSSLKKIFSGLKNKQFILIVPRTDVLLEYEDLESGSTLQDLSYSYEFVASHILLPGVDEGLSENEFRTLNGKTVLLRAQNGILYTAAGFDSRKKYRIINFELFPNFNDYLKGSDDFPIIRVDMPLVGNLVKREDWQTFRPKLPENTQLTISDKERLVREHSSFEQIMRIHPTLGNSFNELFRSQRSIIATSPNNLDTLAALFGRFCADAFKLLSSEGQFDSFTNKFQLVHEYVELNLYDDFWTRITSIYQGNELESICDYKSLQYMSINQVSTFLYPRNHRKFNLQNVTSAEKNIEAATNCIKKLAISSYHSEKSMIIVETLQTLTRNVTGGKEEITIDADTLMSMMVLVVCRSQLKNLKAHLAYLQKFSENQTSVTFGILAYGLSTLEAVLCYFEDKSKLQNLEEKCLRNKNLWDVLSSNNNGLQELKTPHDYTDILAVRTAEGNSCLSFCIQNNNLAMFKDLFLNYEAQFPLEDILYDETTDKNTLLIQALERGEEEAAKILVDTLCNSCTKIELTLYLNRTNKANRTAAHYLMHAPKLIRRIGYLFDWELKDITGHTPLFAIFRSYDHTEYDTMVSQAYEAASKWYNTQGKRFQLSTHMDGKSNTLLHIIKSHVEILLPHHGIRINAANKKGLTPLMVYTRYNRLDNIKSISADKRLIIDKLQNTTFLSCFDYVKNPVVLQELGRQVSQFSAFTQVSVHNIKYECEDWFMWMTVKSSNPSPQYKTLKHTLKSIQSLFLLFLKSYPMTFLPVQHVISELKSLSRFQIININRLETDKFLHNMTFYLSIINQDSTFKDVLALPDAEFVQWVKNGTKKQKRQTTERIEPEEIHSIQKFMRFNLAELLAIQTNATILEKLVAFMNLKSTDVNESYHILFGRGLSIQFDQMSKMFRLSHDVNFLMEKYPFNSLSNHLRFFEKCTCNLIEKVKCTLDVKIPKWWQLYGELIDLRNEYNKNFPNSVKPHVMSSSGMFGSYIETKRFKLEEGLSTKIKVCLKRLVLLNSSIKEDNEMLAEEVSKYLSFKGEFWKNGIIRDFSMKSIKALNEQLECMEEVLWDYHNQFHL